MNVLAVSIGVLLFPGLIACVIADKICPHVKKWGSFKYSIYSFVFGVMCYIFLQILYFLFVIFSSFYINNLYPFLHVNTSVRFEILHVWTIATAQVVDIKLYEVLLATITAPVVASIATFVINYKLLNKFAEKIHVSNKYGDENLFSFYLNTKEVSWVYIRDPEMNQTYEGRILSWSENDHIQEIVLYDVTIYEYETSKKLYSLPSIYLAKPTGTFIIESIPEPSRENGNEKTTSE